jgi:predicted outer membrane protein
MITNGLIRKVLVYVVSTLLASGTAFACGGSSCTCNTLVQAIDQITAAEAQSSDAASAQYSQLRMLGDQDFMRAAMDDSATKILLGQMALKKSQRNDLKQFARQLIQDQTELSLQVLERVGKRLGVQEEKDLSKKSMQLVARLATLSGSQFDEEFVKTMLKNQRQDLKKFGDETQLAVDPRVQIAAQYGKKLISQHVEALQRISESQSTVAENQAAMIGARH